MALTLPVPLGPSHAALQRHQLALHVPRRQVHARRAALADRDALASWWPWRVLGARSIVFVPGGFPLQGFLFEAVPYLDFSLIPSIIVFICGCRSPIICIIADIERCITSGIF
jgi:hypothetical protein